MSLTVVISPHRYTVGMMNYQEATRPINDRFYAEGTHLIKERNIFLLNWDGSFDELQE